MTDESSKNFSKKQEKLSSKNSLRVKGVTKRIHKFLWDYPHASPKEVCRVLELPYKKYRQTVSAIKYELNKNSKVRIGHRKFSDRDIFFLHSKGLSDYVIAEKLGITEQSVWRRRQKLGLRPNYSPRFQKNNQINKGRSPSIETRRKLSIAFKGRKPWNTGKHLSFEHRIKIKRANQGKLMGEKNPNFGKVSYPKPYKPNGLEHFVRSSWEEKVCRFLIEKGIRYAYESESFQYFLRNRKRSYTPDIKIGNDFFIEVKAVPFKQEIQKFEAIKYYFPFLKIILITDKNYIDSFPSNFFEARFAITELENLSDFLTEAKF